MTNLHLGCGKRFLPGYVHVDLSDYEHITHNHDIRTLPMFEDNSVDLIYASHVLEYFTSTEVLSVLGEWKRTLKPGGLLRLAVPNFHALVEVYKTTGSLGNILGPLYGHWDVSDDTSISHKTVYNFTTLAGLLYGAGFISVEPWNWRTVFVGELEGFDDYSQAYYPHMDKEHGIHISLNVEATKL